MKTSEIQGLSEQDLISRIKEEKEALHKMTMNHAVSPVDNPAVIRTNRRNIAKLMTELNKRKASK
ncbi:MAG: 50S ribosomal protein L29 [Bacteroidia bacterium]